MMRLNASCAKRVPRFEPVRVWTSSRKVTSHFSALVHGLKRTCDGSPLRDSGSLRRQSVCSTGWRLSSTAGTSTVEVTEQTEAPAEFCVYMEVRWAAVLQLGTNTHMNAEFSHSSDVHSQFGRYWRHISSRYSAKLTEPREFCHGGASGPRQ